MAVDRSMDGSVDRSMDVDWSVDGGLVDRYRRHPTIVILKPAAQPTRPPRSSAG
jgi:hypothetical protein